MRNLARSPRGWAFASLAAAGVLTPFGWSWAASTRVGGPSSTRNASVATDVLPVKKGDSPNLWSRLTGSTRKSTKQDPFLDDPAVSTALGDSKTGSQTPAKKPPAVKKPITTDAARIARATPTTITGVEPKPPAGVEPKPTASRGATAAKRPARSVVDAGSRSATSPTTAKRPVADSPRSQGTASPGGTSASTARSGRSRVIPDDAPTTEQSPAVASARSADKITRISADRDTPTRPTKTSAPLDEALRLRAEQLLFRAKEAERLGRLTDALTLAEAAARIETQNPQLFSPADSPTAYLAALEEHCRIAWESQAEKRDVAATRTASAPKTRVAQTGAVPPKSKTPTTAARTRPGNPRAIPDATPGGTVAAASAKDAAPVRKTTPRVADTKPRVANTLPQRATAETIATKSPPTASPIERTRGEQAAPEIPAASVVTRTIKPTTPASQVAPQDDEIPVTRRRLDPGLASNLARAGEAAAAHPTDVPKRQKPAIPERDGHEEARAPRVASADHQSTVDEAIAQDARDRDGSAATLARAVAARSDLHEPGRSRVTANDAAATEPYRGPVIRPMTAARVDELPAGAPATDAASASVANLKPVPETPALPAPGANPPSIPVLTTPGPTPDATPPQPPPAAPPAPVEVAAATAPALVPPPTLTPPTAAPESPPPAVAPPAPAAEPAAEPAPGPAPGPALVAPAPTAPAAPPPAEAAPVAPVAETATTEVAPDAETSPRGWSLRQWRKFWIPVGGLAGGLTGLLGLLVWQSLERRAFARKRTLERRTG
jgi:hypothetical protein